jgi:hypothetical protein
METYRHGREVESTLEGVETYRHGREVGSTLGRSCIVPCSGGLGSEVEVVVETYRHGREVGSTLEGGDLSSRS